MKDATGKRGGKWGEIVQHTYEAWIRDIDHDHYRTKNVNRRNSLKKTRKQDFYCTE